MLNTPAGKQQQAKGRQQIARSRGEHLGNAEDADSTAGEGQVEDRRFKV